MVWDELPEGWEVRRLGNVCEVVGGGTPRRNRPEYFGGQIPWVRPSDLPPIGEVIPVSGAAEYITEAGLQNSSAKLLPAGTVLFSSRASIGKIAIAQVELATNQGFANFICDGSVIDNWYLAYVLRCFTPAIEALAGKTTFKEVGRTKLREFEIPLPPLPEQRRIVARIEALTERIDAARRLRTEAAEEATAILPSALAEVFGEAEERGWEKYRLADVALIGTPKGWKPRPKDGKIPFIEMADIDQETGLNSRYVWADYDKVSKGKVKFQSDAILVAKITPCTENNKTALAPEMPTDGGFATTEVFAVHPTGFTNRLYLLAFLRSPQVRVELVSSMTGSTGRQRVPRQALENLEMPLPSLDEQHRLVEYLDAVQAKVEAIRRYQEETQNEIEAMTGAVLERAFRGEL